MARKLGKMMTGGDAGNRQENDYYGTPEDCTTALVREERERLALLERLWEPACGEGAICDVLAENGLSFIGTDLVDRDYLGHEHTMDFLETNVRLAPGIITNPPFSLAAKFIHHAHHLGVDYMALLLKSTFWHAERRRRLFELWTPRRIYAMTWRPDFLKKGAPTMDCMWCVWDGLNVNRETSYRLLRQP